MMVFNEDFDLYYEDIANYDWTELDCVDDMFMARRALETYGWTPQVGIREGPKCVVEAE